MYLLMTSFTYLKVLDPQDHHLSYTEWSGPSCAYC